MPSFQVLNGPTIAAGQSLSDALDCRAGTPVRITMPASWEGGADITFQISTDDIGYNDVVYPNGGEVTCEVVPGTALLLPAEIGNAIAFLKIRSGPASAPMVQNTQQTFAVAIRLDVAPAMSATQTAKPKAKRK